MLSWSSLQQSRRTWFWVLADAMRIAFLSPLFCFFKFVFVYLSHSTKSKILNFWINTKNRNSTVIHTYNKCWLSLIINFFLIYFKLYVIIVIYILIDIDLSKYIICFPCWVYLYAHGEKKKNLFLGVNFF